MDLKIRDANAHDASFLAWLILTAGRAHVKRGIWEVILDQPGEDCLNFLRLLTVTKIPHLFHHSCYLVAESENRPVAGLGGYDPTVLGYHALQEAMPEVFRKMRRSPSKEMTPSGPPKIADCIPPTVEGAWVIDSVATLPEFRRRGIVSRLLDNGLEMGREKGFRCAQINIYIGNIPAQRLYEKYGFKIVDEKRDPYFEMQIGSPGMARMLRDL
jgi:ribosomal protein S18 acetylase RimI-like enzyme